jgi:anti-anti-sigma factor
MEREGRFFPTASGGHRPVDQLVRTGGRVPKRAGSAQWPRCSMATGPAKIVIQRMWDVTIVDFQEARLLEVHQIDAISEELSRLVEKMDRKKLILDFSKVQFLASAAIGMLSTLHKKITAIGGTFVICGLRKDLMKVFEIMKLTKVFKFAANEGEAMRMFGYTAAQ